MPVTQQKVRSNDEIISVDQFTITHQDRILLKDIAMTVTKGAFHCIIGESGSGKTLLTRAILQMNAPQLEQKGTIAVDLVQVDAVFQDAQSNMFQNVTLQKHFNALYATKSKRPSRKDQQSEIHQMMTQLGLSQPEQLLKRYPFELSGGMAQRIAFIMALVRQPDCLVLDEPTSALDQENSQKFMHHLMEVIRQRDLTVLFVTHDFNLVRRYATHVSVMKSGEMIESGPVTQILSRPKHPYTQQLIEAANRRNAYVTY
ncbi:ATP-binding cassette domain-containing protein [Staphylococcus coagulans]|uniref:ATP-binding cassette domain-containing protein n=1 Tax=Staphylococcus coagulans TaxID=74706 RepID=UPI003364FA15